MTTMRDLTPTTRVTTAGGTPSCSRWRDADGALEAAWAIEGLGGEGLIMELETDPDAVLS